jgi:hypothetical protein
MDTCLTIGNFNLGVCRASQQYRIKRTNFAPVFWNTSIRLGVHNGHPIRFVIIFYGKNQCAGQGCGLNEGGIY